MLVAAYFENSNGVDPVSKDAVVVIDNKIINQDIFVQHKSLKSGKTLCNFYMELEQVKLNLNEATVATLKDMRGRE